MACHPVPEYHHKIIYSSTPGSFVTTSFEKAREFRRRTAAHKKQTNDANSNKQTTHRPGTTCSTLGERVRFQQQRYQHQEQEVVIFVIFLVELAFSFSTIALAFSTIALAFSIIAISYSPKKRKKQDEVLVGSDNNK